jgi:hypothetical protein
VFKAFSPDRDVIGYIWSITNGHPAAVRLILQILATSEVSISTDTDAILKPTFVSRYRGHALCVRKVLLLRLMSLLGT